MTIARLYSLYVTEVQAQTMLACDDGALRSFDIANTKFPQKSSIVKSKTSDINEKMSRQLHLKM